MRYLEIVDEVGPDVTVVAVSKYRHVDEIQRLYDAGCRDFAENRVFEALDKQEQLPGDIRWHLTGSLQRKKVPKVLGRFHLIQSVDSYELAEKLSKGGVAIKVLLQVNTCGESYKHGFEPSELRESLPLLPNLEILGLMTMAHRTPDEGLIRGCFQELRRLREDLAVQCPTLKELSMGMSNDYPLAVEEGATMLRLGTILFE